MSWYVEFTCRTKERASELIDAHFAQTKDHNPDWEVLAGATKVLVSILPEPGTTNLVRVQSTGHVTHSSLSNSGRGEIRADLVPFSE